MDFSKIAPTIDDFLEQVDAINFDKEEIDFQKKIIKKHTKFKSFDQYIENFHFILANIIDLNKVLNGFSYEEDNQIKFSGDLNILIIKNLNSSVIEEQIKWNQQLSKLSNEKRKLFDNFETKLLNLFMRLVIENSKTDPTASETLQALLTDFENQKKSIEINDTRQVIDPLEYIQAVSLPNLNKRIQNLDSKNFYFQKKSQNLKKLHDAPYVLTKPIHGSQKKKKHDENGLILTIEVIPNIEFEKLILSFGDKVKVVSPKKIADLFKSKYISATKLY